MKKNFETLEVGRRYENHFGAVVKIVKSDNNDMYPFEDDGGKSYAPEGKFFSTLENDKFNLIKLLPEEPTDRLAELEAKREELDKEIEELKKNTQTLYCEAYSHPHDHDVLVIVDAYRTNEQREDAMRQLDELYPSIATFDLPFHKVNGKWEAAFEIVLK